MFLLNALFNFPRQRISKSLKTFILFVLRECGAKNVPSLGALEKVQAQLDAKGGVPTVPWTSVMGNIFFMNDVRTIIAQVSTNLSFM